MQALAQCHLETKTVVAVLFKNLSGRPFLGKVVFSIWSMQIYSDTIFLPTDQRMIKNLSQVMSAALVYIATLQHLHAKMKIHTKLNHYNQLAVVWLLNYSILLKTRHNEIIHELIA